MIDARRLTAKERFAQYIESIVDGTIPACKYVKLAVDRHMRDMGRVDDEEWPYRFDDYEADRAVDFIEGLRHSKGKWARQKLKLRLEPWQVFIVRILFGWRQKANGFRRFRISYAEIARKNGKSTLAAGIGLYLFIADDEPGAEVYSTATNRAQARVVHEEAKRMVQKSPTLRRLCKITRDNLAYNDSKYEPLASNDKAHEGRNVSAAIIDELHAHPTRAIFDVMDQGTGAREQALLLMITTAGEGGREESICWEQHDYTIKVLEGIVDDETWFGIIFTLDKGDDWSDEETWIKANPNLGVSVGLDDLRAKVKKALTTPSASITVRQKHFDLWVGSFDAWLAPEIWKRNRGKCDWYAPGRVFSADALDYFRGRECFVGCDLSSVDDLTGIVAAFPNEETEGVDLLAWGWVPRNNAIGFDRDRRTPYLSFAERGYLALTEGESVDYDAARGLLVRMRDEWEFDIQEIAFDPANAHYVFDRLHNDDEFDEEELVKHRQGALSMNDPIKATQKLLLDRKLRHGGNRALGWCVSNVVARSDDKGNLQFDKKRSREKIDLAVAMVMAVGRAVASGGVSESSSVYENRGAIFV